MKTYKLLGLLLTYPDGTVYSASHELLQTLHSESLLSQKFIKKVGIFLTTQKEKDLIAAQEDYVETFDRGRSHCLNLFEHIHGESRDRGQAMINLSETYLTKGLHIDSGELPDYLPLFMEYLSLCDPKDAIELLGEAIDVIALIGTKLKKNKSPYAGIFECIEVLSVTKADSKKIKNAIRESRKDPETLEELDEQWKEADAFTGDPFVDVETDCNKCNAFPNTTEVLNNMAGDKK
jgi:nitrate reductase molybdenum cofactor assembly chaperone NarJ/NarW